MIRFQAFFKIFGAVLIAVFIQGDLALAQSPAERFSEFDPTSTVRVDHQPLSDFLSVTVLPVGRSYRIMGNEKPETYRASRIKTAKSLSPSRFEGSRLLIHAFTDDHRGFFKAYQEGLEHLSNRRPLRELNKNEQLAFWLNLYNVIVINKVIAEYPIEKLKSWRSTKRGQKAFWDEKVTTIEGVPLSLTEIENILIANFDKPEVVFGLWQGSIGGPRLLNYAFTGRNVWRSLENNAVEFVNSNRGLRPPTGTRMSVSDFYEWMLPAFGTSEDHVLMFIKEYADPNFVDGVSNVTSLSFKLYDWQIADLVGGTKHSGQYNQLGGLQAAHGGGRTGGGTGGIPVFNEGGSAYANYRPDAIYNFVLSKTPTGPTEGLPPQAYDIILGIRTNTRQLIPVITSEECAPGEECTIERPGGEDDGDG